jgi:hypothetical protein
MKNSTVIALALVAAFGVMPVSAQTPPKNQPEIGTATISPTGIPPSQRNPLLTDNGAVRIGKLLGTAIYNRDDKKIGNVDDVLAGQDGQLAVVISTNSKRVAVPWNMLVFGDAKLNSDNKILMPDETQESLNKLPEFSYQNKKG